MNASTGQTPQHIFAIGVRSAHALEKQALQIMNRQVERLQHYPQVEARLRTHIEETHGQIQRLDEILDNIGESRSVLKELALGTVGNLMAIGHSVFEDEILKNMFANVAFENFEAASYKGLITVAEAAGQQSSITALQQTLQEEENMIRWLNENLRDVTMTYLSREAEGVKAGR